jgi:catechol 2,3-dioxygenase
MSDAAAPAGVKELGHVVLYVRDLERSVAFYRDVLGWPAIEEGGVGLPAMAFTTGRTHHELLLIEVGAEAAPIPAGRRVGLYHVGLKVGDSDDDLRAIVDRLLARPDLTRIVGMTDHTVTHSVYVTDPDGNELELYIDVPGVDWRSDPSLLLSPPRRLNL